MGLDAVALYKAFADFGPVPRHVPDAIDAARKFDVDSRLLITILLMEGENRQRLLEPALFLEKIQVALQDDPSIGIVQMKFTTFLATTARHLDVFGIPRGFGSDVGRCQAFMRRLQRPQEALRYAAAYLADIRAGLEVADHQSVSILAATYNTGLSNYRNDFLRTGEFGSSADQYTERSRTLDWPRFTK